MVIGDTAFLDELVVSMLLKSSSHRRVKSAMLRCRAVKIDWKPHGCFA